MVKIGGQAGRRGDTHSRPLDTAVGLGDHPGKVGVGEVGRLVALA